MELLGNRAVALLLCLVMIFGASLFGAATSLGALREQSEYSFTSSGMQQDLYDLAGECANIATVAARHLPQDDPDLADAKNRKVSLDEVMWSSSAKEKHDAAQQLMDATWVLLNRVERLSKETTRSYSDLVDDIDLAAGAWAAANSKLELLSRGPYNREAAYYNLMLEKFPANLLGKLTGLKPLELYA